MISFNFIQSPNSSFGGVVTENSKLLVWNVDIVKIHIRSTCDDILNGSGFINLLYITDDGVPFIGTSTGGSHSYSKDLECWMLVNANDALTRNGLHGSITNVKNMKSYPVATLQYVSHSFQQKAKPAIEM